MRFILMCDIPFNSAHILSIDVGELGLIGVILYIKREFIPDLRKGGGGHNNPFKGKLLDLDETSVEINVFLKKEETI